MILDPLFSFLFSVTSILLGFGISKDKRFCLDGRSFEQQNTRALDQEQVSKNHRDIMDCNCTSGNRIVLFFTYTVSWSSYEQR
ncbi:hypothetical protein JHK82_044318 [Glycine max]|nr:hypothetical protein JHK86_044667 [Glycine max]KAG4940639.1 hypothetical protein JHK87_044510 [Glycine soja]KAG5099266.1 hypothetical protein JHK82_044318 [Glycine max]KAG5107870.1 hypothetical protein JHK84_044777 [Glycine max]KHN27498.1 hypothetical protein glysoja_018610 [Glycine soja]